MKIASVKFIHPYSKVNYNSNNNEVSNPFTSDYNKSSALSNVSFGNLVSNADLLRQGYKVAKVSDNKISNNEDCIMISSADKFLALANSPSVWNKKIVLTENIDLKGAQIKPIGNASKPFKGEFDGNGCKISNFTINSPEGRNVGLFSKCESAKISNIEVSDAYIKGRQQVAGISGYAKNSSFENCKFNGYLEGEKKVGGLVALGKQNNITGCSTGGTIKVQDCSTETDIFGNRTYQFVSTGIAGGLISADSESEINNSYSTSTIFADNQAGGLIGYSENSSISDCNYNGILSGNQKVGGLIGWGLNSKINSSYALSDKNNLIGDNTNCSTACSYYDLNEIIDKAKNWNPRVWNIDSTRLPRLRFQAEQMPPEKLFLEDINTDIQTGRINAKINPVVEEVPLNILPPKHYPQNDKILKSIRECKDEDTLFEKFGEFVRDDRYKLPTDEIKEEYKEILLEFVKNPNMNLNRRFEYSYCVTCTPLFIITTINEPYALQEALKRDDVNPTIGSGFYYDKTILNRAVDNHIDSCFYVMLNSPKMRDEIEKHLDSIKGRNLSPLAKLLLECYPDIPKLDSKKGSITFSKQFDVPPELLAELKKISRLQDVQKNILISENYRDSRGNNIANVLTTLDDEKEALGILLTAEKLGTDLNNWNNNAESPMGNALYRKFPHIVARLLPKSNSPFTRVNEGTDSLLLFSNLEDDNLSVNYMDIAKNLGLSVDTSDDLGMTPLMYAIERGNSKSIKYLLSKGANPNLADSSGQTALHHACMNNDVDTINLLLDNYAYPLVRDSIGNTPEDYLDDETKEKLSAKFQEKIDMYEISGLGGGYDGVMHRQNYDDFEDVYGIQNLEYAISFKENHDKELMMFYKNIYKRPEILHNIDSFGDHALTSIAKSKSPYSNSCLKAALEKGGNINLANYNKETPLICALNEFICSENLEDKINILRNIKLILESNPDVDMVDNNNQSALHKICESGNLILFNEILKHNPKINQVDIIGKTAFEYIPPEANATMYYVAKEYLKNSKIIKEDK